MGGVLSNNSTHWDEQVQKRMIKRVVSKTTRWRSPPQYLQLGGGDPKAFMSSHGSQPRNRKYAKGNEWKTLRPSNRYQVCADETCCVTASNAAPIKFWQNGGVIIWELCYYVNILIRNSIWLFDKHGWYNY